jgi:hypothetical protein
VVRETTERTSRLFRISVTAVLVLGLCALVYSEWTAHRLRQDVRRLREAVASANEEQRQFMARIAEERERAQDEKRRLEKEIAEARVREPWAGCARPSPRRPVGARGPAHTASARPESERAVGERIIRDYGGGGLIQAVTWRRSGRPSVPPRRGRVAAPQGRRDVLSLRGHGRSHTPTISAPASWWTPKACS